MIPKVHPEVPGPGIRWSEQAAPELPRALETAAHGAAAWAYLEAFARRAGLTITGRSIETDIGTAWVIAHVVRGHVRNGIEMELAFGPFESVTIDAERAVVGDAVDGHA